MARREASGRRQLALVGLIVNPIAGMGGKVGLKGTDGTKIFREALRRGAAPVSPERTVKALVSLRLANPSINVVTCPGLMGRAEASEAGISHTVLPLASGRSTTSRDTRNAAKLIARRKVRLILFAGGDGTARDISKAIGLRVPALGIPCGVKNYSAVFARSPEAAGQLAADFVRDEIGVAEQEVIDYDEDSMRAGRIKVVVKGILNVPLSARFMQGAKSSLVSPDDRIEKDGIAKFVAEQIDSRILYVLGPGSTVGRIAERLGIKKTVLGVDVMEAGKLIAKDASGAELERLVGKSPTKLIVTPIGGQGYILGRGNQQLTPKVLRKIGKENMIVVCTRSKLTSLPQRKFLVDTGDAELDKSLRGYCRAIIDYRQFALVKVDVE